MSKARSWKESKKFARLKKKLFKNSDGKCFYCKGFMTRDIRHGDEDMTVDHLIPRAQGGEDTEQNCVVCCRRCNQLRGKQNIKEFVAKHYPWKFYPKVSGE